MTATSPTIVDEGHALIKRGAPWTYDETKIIEAGAAALGDKARTAAERQLEAAAQRLRVYCSPTQPAKIISTPFDAEVAAGKVARDAAFAEEESARNELFDARDDRYRLVQYELVYEGRANTQKRLYIARDSTPESREAALVRVERAEDRHRKAEHDLSAANAHFGRANQRREQHIVGFGLR